MVLDKKTIAWVLCKHRCALEDCQDIGRDIDGAERVRIGYIQADSPLMSLHERHSRGPVSDHVLQPYGLFTQFSYLCGDPDFLVISPRTMIPAGGFHEAEQDVSLAPHIAHG
jgi:hypothetical protein